jgi:hypothetical protein
MKLFLIWLCVKICLFMGQYYLNLWYVRTRLHFYFFSLENYSYEIVKRRQLGSMPNWVWTYQSDRLFLGVTRYYLKKSLNKLSAEVKFISLDEYLSKNSIYTSTRRVTGNSVVLAAVGVASLNLIRSVARSQCRSQFRSISDVLISGGSRIGRLGG